MKHCIGVDLGGTTLRAALVSVGDFSGQVHGWITRPSSIRSGVASHDFTATLASIEQIVVQCLNKAGVEAHQVVGIGIAIPDPIHPQTGNLVSPTQLLGGDGYPITSVLRQRLQSQFGSQLHIKVANDANLAALAEYRFRTSRQGMLSKNFAYLTVSTGIGAGLIIQGELYEGTNGYAGEVGHVVVDTSSSHQCPGCHQYGCLEVLSSGTAIAREGAALVDSASLLLKRAVMQSSHVEHELTLSDCLSPNGLRVTALNVINAARQHDQGCMQILQRASHYLGLGITQLLHTLNPDHVIVGGSIVKEDALFWQPTLDVVRRVALKATRDVCVIDRPLLHDHTGVLGAAYRVMDII